ncbi:hypothetical protein [Pectobacterium sp. A5351]|uniref:hypothetical protein n=1 Tax=Pectobacterium sp. A5351 TaxID=2914983 RepID=UPI00232DEF89|nr:hypothetical protein [Pectobacterium sp. A5351]WCG83937.1 hypothetical protein O1Q74_04415 [Pectobacterium sp. A5351]
MTAIPLPLITALLLVILFFRVRFLDIQQHLSNKNIPNKNAKKRNAKAEALFIGVSCLALTLVALRWSGHVALPTLIQPAIAASIPPLLWLCLFPHDKTHRHHNALRHLLAPLLVFGASVIQSRTAVPLIDLMLVSIYFGYGSALIYIARRLHFPLEWWKSTPFIAGLYVIISGAIDMMIALDIAFYSGSRATTIITAFHFLMLAILTLLIVTHRTTPQAGLVPAPDKKPEAPPATCPVFSGVASKAVITRLRSRGRCQSA